MKTTIESEIDLMWKSILNGNNNPKNKNVSEINKAIYSEIKKQENTFLLFV